MFPNVGYSPRTGIVFQYGANNHDSFDEDLPGIHA